jgi:hypothetical protein
MGGGFSAGGEAVRVMILEFLESLKPKLSDGWGFFRGWGHRTCDDRAFGKHVNSADVEWCGYQQTTTAILL